MLQPGKFQHLTVVKEVSFGVFLDGGEEGNILLPKRYLPAGTRVGDSLEVFIYFDSEDQLIATTERPLAQLGQCALLRAKDVNRTGAFLDWGLAKDLLVPFREQQRPMQQGRQYVVCVYRDSGSGRLAASSRLNRHLPERAHHLQPNQAVELLVWGQSDMGYKVVIDNEVLGLLYRDDAFKPLRYGQRVRGYIKNVRPDGKINVSLQLPAVAQREQLTEAILAHLRANGGMSELTDRSAPDAIYHQYNVSKASYKKALGKLYKERRIALDPQQVRLLPEQE